VNAPMQPRIVDMAQAIREAEGPLPWRVKPLALDGAVTVLVGRPGESKSWLALFMCSAVHGGHALDSFTVEHGSAVYLDVENGSRCLGRGSSSLGSTPPRSSSPTGPGCACPTARARFSR
jgi:AAA domain